MRRYTNHSMHDVYIGEHNRTYLVTPYALAYALRRDAKSRFKVANNRIAIVTAWVIGEDLYHQRDHRDDGAVRADVAARVQIVHNGEGVG